MGLHVEKESHVGEMVRVRARLVAKGFLQKEGVDFLKTFSPTPVPSPIRITGVGLLHYDWVLDD